MPRARLKTLLLRACACSLLLSPAAAYAQQTILDEEFQQAAQALTQPLRGTLAPHTPVHFVLINDPSINAYVTQENIVFVHSGLVAATKNAGELQGVLAHELGHITANHLLQQEVQQKQAMIGALAGAALGIGAAVAGAPQAAGALMIGGQAGAIQSILSHTRTQEAEADARAIEGLHGAGFSVRGMVGMFETLHTESQLSYDSPPPWLVTHPLPPERLATLERAEQGESATEKTSLAKLDGSFNYSRLQAKVMALTSSPAAVLRKYNAFDDTSHYAMALAYTAQGKLDFAESHLDPLLKAHPSDPFYRELKGQIALQRGNLPAAYALYRDLVHDHPDYLMFQYQYAEILRNMEGFKDAIPHYKAVTRAWPEWSEPWLGLGLCYGSLGQFAASHLARTQGFLVAPDYEAAKQSLALAKSYLKKTPDADLQNWADTLQTQLDARK